MSISRKWNPNHYRRGCWVRSHQRAKGVIVKSHWRGEHEVKGHFSAFIPKQLSLEETSHQAPATRESDDTTQLSLLNQSQGGMCICRVLGIGAGVSRECFGP